MICVMVFPGFLFPEPQIEFGEPCVALEAMVNSSDIQPRCLVDRLLIEARTADKHDFFGVATQ